MNGPVSEVAAPTTPLDGATSGADKLHALPQIPDHELIRCIGRGSYGEVWLARNIMGTYRAVKIVYRHTFKDAHPFEREFNGIQKFEPVSRTHEGLVDVLQIGRNDRDGYFYYVMELADDSSEIRNPESGIRNWESYAPKTICAEISRRGRLPFEECLQLSLSLTAALSHLHKGGLVHRDIKPSNIIFVNGIPKLADIGLVADASDAKSYVGTEGFIPPEGPGTPQADIYSLGKVLYEIATGKDRQCFPEPPTLLGEFSDREQLLELNEVVLKACASDPHQRYQTPEEMQVDLALLRSGNSVRRLRAVEVRLARTRRVGLLAMSVALVATLVGLLFAHQVRVEHESSKRIQEALTRAEAAEQSARQESYSRAMLLAHEAVRASNFGLVRELLQQTRSFAEQTGTSNGSPTALAWEWRHLQYECRDESAPVLVRRAKSVDSVTVSPDGAWLAAGDGDGRVLLWSLPNRELRQQWQIMREGVECLAFDPDSRRLAVGCVDGWVRTVAVASGKLIAEFREQSRILDLRFSADGRYLADCSVHGFGFHDFQTSTDSPRRGDLGAFRAAIAPDFKVLAALGPQGLLWYWGDPQTNVVFPDVVGNRFNDHAQAISPDGRWLATALADHSIEIWSLAEKKPLRRLVGHTAAVEAVAWSADSRLLASGGFDQMLAVWDAQRGKLLRRLRGHQDHLTAVAFSPDCRTLFSGSADRTVRAWTDLEAARAPDEIALPPGLEAAEAPDLIGLPPRVFYTQLAPGARFACSLTVPDNTVWTMKTQPGPWIHSRQLVLRTGFGISPDGNWLIATHIVDDLCEVWRYETDRFALRSTHHAIGNAEVPPAFSHDGRRVALLATNGVLAVWEPEPWRGLARWEGVVGRANTIVFDPPDKRVFVRCQNFGVFAADMDTGRLIPIPKRRKAEISGIDISPDNRFLAMSYYDGAVVLWACAPGEEPHSLTPIITERTDAWSVAFSPDGRRLAVGLDDGNIHLWDIERRLLVGVLKGHRQPVWELGFNPADDTLVSISPDELRVWRVTKSDH